jgi:UDPglucose 6-dehydrogenase
MKIIIAGYGFVGKAVANNLKKHYSVEVIDPKFNTNTISNHVDADGIIICVGTPSTSNGQCDASQIIDVLDQCPIHIPVLIKSTVSPDVVAELDIKYPDHSIVYSPEFLRARSAERDFANQTFMIIGGEDPECFWQDLFTPVLSRCRLYFGCTNLEASIIKYTANSFLAVKTSFFNQIYDICESNGADFNVVRQILGHDNRIGSDHTMVPGPDGQRGWGGHCFPKDTTAFIKYSYSLNKPLTILGESVEYNNKIR